MNNVNKLLFIILLIFQSYAKADDPAGGYLSGTEINCPHIEFSESTVIACNKFAYQQADKELNAVYKELITAADAKEKLWLQKMQRAWIELKNAQCGLIAYYHRDVVAEKWQSQCEAVMTIRRVQELKALGTGVAW